MAEALEQTIPAKPPLFYGWVIVGALFVINIVSNAAGGLNLGLFVIPMGSELGITRGMFGWLTSARSLGSGLSSVWLGNALDRYGPRVLVPATATVTALCVAGFALSNSVWPLLALFFVMGMVGLSGGAGILTSVPVAKWFVRRRGTALAVGSLGMGLGAVTFSVVTQWLIAAQGWRGAWVVLAGCVAVAVPVGLIFLRRQPEDMGLRPDGDAALAASGPGSVAPAEVSWSVRQAMGTRTFWLLMVGLVLYSFASGGTSVHRIPYWIELGFDPSLVALAFSFDAVGASTMALGSGFLFDRFPARYVIAVSFVGFAGATFLMLVATNAVYLFASVFLFGLCVGTNMVGQTYIFAHYYGRGSLGAIRGVTMPAMLVAMAAGAPLVGYAYDALGGYTPAWWVTAGVFLASGAVVFFARPPEGKPA